MEGGLEYRALMFLVFDFFFSKEKLERLSVHFEVQNSIFQETKKITLLSGCLISLICFI